MTEIKNNGLDFKHVFREASKPEPIESVLKTQGVIKWGDDNLYPQFLNGLLADNPVHGGIIEQKVKFITAGGVDTRLADKSILNAKRDGYTFEEIMNDCVKDFEIGETFAIHWEKVFEKSGVKWYPKHIDYELLRAKEDVSGYAYCENWMAPSKCPSYKEYTDISRVDKANDNECIQVVITKPKQRVFTNGRKTVLSKAYYPIPSYSGAITDILSGIEMSYFSYAETVNGFKGGTLINFANGKPQDDETKRKFEGGIKEMFTDRNKQGGLAITYSDGKERSPELSQINGNDLDKRYQEAKKTARDAIMVAHGVISPSLFGVFTESLFGSKEEMETAYSLFRENYIVKRQRNVYEPINWAYKLLNGIDPEFYYKDYIPEILRPANSTETATFSKEEQEPTFEQVKAEFEKCGRNKEGLRIIESRCLNMDSFDEEGFKAKYKKSGFARVSELQSRILEMIDNGETYDAIKRALDISSFRLSVELLKLKARKLLEGWGLTQEGVKSIIDETKIEVVYSYEVRNNVPDAKKSREFCEYMINRDMVYTKAEIDNISEVIGRDVWMYRGGWYHNPNTDRNTPFCRHEWKQHVITK